MAEWHNSKEWREARAYAKTILDPVCVSCNKELIDGDWTIDHINPPSTTGGRPDHTISNLQSMCRACNGRKQDRTQIRTNWINPRYNAS